MNPHFATLVMGLAHQANSALDGELPPGADQLPGIDVRQIAQTLIDTLGMLEQKTAGRLDADEQKLLADSLTMLRFRFVQGPGGGPVA
jgi:hypothetical protein